MNKTRVMVFGTFDGLHEGHIDFFKQAKNFTENSFLIVSIARDKNVLKIKGKIPRLSEKERLSLVKKCEIVDKVILGGQTKYLAHILKERPNIIALGYDQEAYVKELKKDLKNMGILTKIIRLKPYKEDIYKNSLLKKNFSIIIFMKQIFSYDTYPWKNTDKFVKNKDVTICYRTYGDIKDPALVMIMGTSAAGTFWSPELCQQISDKGYFVITPDNRDTGKSTSYQNWHGNKNAWVAFFRSLIKKEVEAPYTLYDIAEDYCVLLKELGIEKAHFLGVSLGGMVVQIIASKYSQIIISAIIVNSCNGSYRDIIPSFKYLFFCEYKMRVFRSIQDEQLRAFKYLRWLLHFLDNRKNTRDSQEVDKLVFFNVTRNIVQRGGSRQMLAIIKSLPFNTILSNIKVPTLIIGGKRDFVFSYKKSKKLSDGISGSKLILIEDMGHAVMPSLHKDFTEIVVNYLQKK